MGRLPEPEEQQWLLTSLSRVLLLQGEAPFVKGPLLYPTMEGFEVTLQRFEGDRSVSAVSTSGEAQYRHHGAAAWATLRPDLPPIALGAASSNRPGIQ